MSQQSLTFLSQSASNIFKEHKKAGGTAEFKSGVSGTMKLKVAGHASMVQIALDLKNKENYAEATRAMRLCEYHYATSKAQENERIRLGVNDIPPKPVGGIPGYSGFIPRKEAANVIGETYKTGNVQAAELFATEQEIRRHTAANIKKPDSNLQTPQTY